MWRFWRRGKTRCIRCGKYRADELVSGDVCITCRFQLQDEIARHVGSIAILTAMVKRANAVDELDVKAVGYHRGQARRMLGLIAGVASSIPFGIAAGNTLRHVAAEFTLFVRMRSKTTLLVVAGNFSQFCVWAAANRIPADGYTHYVHSIEQIAGRDPKTVLVVFAGQAHLNPLYSTPELTQLINQANPTDDVWQPDLSIWRRENL